jgi:hypothetical protein
VRAWDAGDPDDNNWGSALNWSGDDVPDTADEVASFTSDAVGANSPNLDGSFTVGGIRLSSNVDVRLISSSAANELTLVEDTGSNPAGILELPSSATLTLDNNMVLVMTSDEPQEIGGTVYMDVPGGGTAAPVIVIEADVTFGPYDPSGTPAYGYVHGYDANAQIQILEPSSGDNTLINEITIEGALDIVPVNGTGTATFDNRYLVHAMEGGVLTLANDLLLADDGASVVRWQATDAGSVLIFANGASLGTKLDVLSCGTLMFFESVSTDETFPFTQGFVDVDTNPGVCFSYSGSAPICNNTENCP